MESKEEIKVNPQQLESSYKEMFSNHVNNKIKNQCFKNKIEFIEVDINRGFETIIDSYLLKRKNDLNIKKNYICNVFQTTVW